MVLPAETQPISYREPPRSALLELPLELLQNILSYICKDDTGRLHPRNKGRLGTAHPVSLTNKTLRHEYIACLLREGDIEAYVLDFDFRYLVTFFNKLSDAQLRMLERKKASNAARPQQALRELHIALDFTPSCPGLLDSYLLRWTKRMEHQSKKGTKVATSYSVASSKSLSKLRGRTLFTRTIEDSSAYSVREGDSASTVEMKKIKEAIYTRRERVRPRASSWERTGMCDGR